MNHLKYLEFQRLMKELQFVESDYEYQNEIIRIKDSDFLNSVNDFLNNYPELQEIFTNKKSAYFCEICGKLNQNIYANRKNQSTKNQRR